MPTIMDEKKDGDAADAPFALRNASGGFEGRSSNIFGQLDVLERQHISHEQNRTDLDEYADLRQEKDDADFFERDNSHKRNISQRKYSGVQQGSGDCFDAEAPGNAESDIFTSEPSGSDGSSRRQENQGRELSRRQPSRQDPQFRRPSGRPPGRSRGRRGRIPDHGKRPHNWTYYSLEDVKGSDMSDKANTQAALAFLDERRKLKEKEEDMDTEAFDAESAACSKGLFSFTKRNRAEKSSSTVDKNINNHEKDLSSPTDSADKPDKDKAPVSTVTLASSDTEGDVEQTLEEETDESSSSSMAKKEKGQTGFKNRKGIRRNIRSRDDDD